MLIKKNQKWSVRITKLVIFIVALVLLTPNLFSQERNSTLVPLKVKKGSYVYLKDSLYYFNYDTILYLSNSLLPDKPEDIEKTRIFYDSLKIKAARRGLTKGLYDLVIVLPPGNDYQDIRTSINEDYSESEGKTIRKITLKRLDPFGTNINNPEQNSAEGFSGLLNRTHPTTREFVLRNYLLFREGENLSSLRITESERILRKLKYIDDARILVIPVSDDMVDIHIVTRDVYSLGLYYEIRGAKSGTVELFERNLLGLGHDLVLAFPYDYYVDYYGFGYQLSYNLKNISRSLIDASLSYSNALGKEYYDLNFERRFITATTKYAGGFNIRETYTSNDLDTLESRVPVEYNNLDMWFGRSFMLDSTSLTRLVLSARHVNNNVYERPEISSTSYYSLQKYKLYLGSLSIVRQRYFKTNLIYNYGRTEDIPYGSKLQITYGREFNEFSIRDYFGIGASVANLPGKAGYFYLSSRLGLFTDNNVTEQGALDFRLNYISNLTSMGRYRLRYFANMKYTKGIQRFDDEYLRINDQTGIRGFSNDTIRPVQSLILNLEAVSFSPIYVYGFRFVFYGFTDIGLFSNDTPFSINENLISEIGLGLRIRNDNLIFKTIQFRFSWFPFTPPYSQTRFMDVTGERLLESPNFDPGPPGLIYYR